MEEREAFASEAESIDLKRIDARLGALWGAWRPDLPGPMEDIATGTAARWRGAD